MFAYLSYQTPLIFGFAYGYTAGGESLNCSFGKGDDDNQVQDNRWRLYHQFSPSPALHTPVHYLKQCHSNKVVYVDESSKGCVYEADALVTDQPGVCLALQTADCLPILLYTPHVIAAVHAGWRGLATGIIPNTLAMMQDYGAVLSDIEAAIGPAIYSIDYVVGDEVRQHFNDPAYDQAFSAQAHSQGHLQENMLERKYHGDLQTIAHYQLRSLKNIWISPLNTYQDPRFFSFRRNSHENKPHAGNQASLIMRR